MAFNALMAKAAHAASKSLQGRSKGVVELGNQSWRGRSAGVPGTDGITSVKDFYERLGFKRYLALDINTERDAVVFDLNAPDVSRPDINGPFDLVTNNGTSEHIFNQAALLEAMHDLCNPDGGLMLHCIPFWRWPNHGFYCYQPILFRDIAAANQYALLFAWAGLSKGRYTAIGNELKDIFFTEGRHEELGRFMDLNYKDRDVMFVVCLRRQKASVFRYPIQGKYKRAISDTLLADKYR